MKKLFLTVATAAALSLGAIHLATADDTSASSYNSNAAEAEKIIEQQLDQIAKDPSTAADKLFVLEAAKGNMKEAVLAQQVMSKVKNQEVKQLAQQINQDHNKAQEQLRQVAESLNIKLPQALPQAEQKMIQIIVSLPAD